MRVILGLSAYYHDSAATLLVDGVVVAAAQEERFSRKKGDSSFPEQAIKFCLQQNFLPCNKDRYGDRRYKSALRMRKTQGT